MLHSLTIDKKGICCDLTRPSEINARLSLVTKRLDHNYFIEKISTLRKSIFKHCITEHNTEISIDLESIFSKGKSIIIALNQVGDEAFLCFIGIGRTI